MLPLSCSSDISVPKGWPKHIKSAVLQVISLAHYAITYARGWAAIRRMLGRLSDMAIFSFRLWEVIYTAGPSP